MYGKQQRIRGASRQCAIQIHVYLTLLYRHHTEVTKSSQSNRTFLRGGLAELYQTGRDVKRIQMLEAEAEAKHVRRRARPRPEP